MIGGERLVSPGVKDAGEVLTLQRFAYVAEADADPDLPARGQSLAELTAELADAQVLTAG
ncbi:MAG: hypothetical protein ACR2NR_07915 [Solirubrobacteraceae bacterium]